MKPASVALLLFACTCWTQETAFGQSSPKRLFVDPATRWISGHDSKGSGARAEFTLDISKSCPEVITPTDTRESADYTVLIDRTGISAGSVLIYSGGDMVHSFKPGHTSTLRKVADAVCEFVRTRK